MDVVYSRKIEKDVARLGANLRMVFGLLVEDLVATQGKPFGRGWDNFGSLPKMGRNIYHCHLNYNYVVVWHVDARKGQCQVVYVGTRERCPY